MLPGELRSQCPGEENLFIFNEEARFIAGTWDLKPKSQLHHGYQPQLDPLRGPTRWLQPEVKNSSEDPIVRRSPGKKNKRTQFDLRFWFGLFCHVEVWVILRFTLVVWSFRGSGH